MISLPNSPPDRFPAPGLHAPPAIVPNEDRISAGIRRAPSSGQLHLLKKRSCILEITNPAERRDEGVVGDDIRLAMQLFHSIECGQGLLGQTLIAKDLDDGGDGGGGD